VISGKRNKKAKQFCHNKDKLEEEEENLQFLKLSIKLLVVMY